MNKEFTSIYYHYRLNHGQFVPASKALALARIAIEKKEDAGSWSPWRVNNEYEWQSYLGFKHCRWLGIDELRDMRRVGFADKIIRLNHTGWYCDPCGDDPIQGVVYQLPAHKGVSRYIYGYAEPRNDEAFLCFDWCDSKECAARKADNMAERTADKEREHRAKELANDEIEDAKQRINQIRGECLELTREIRGNTYSPAVCLSIRKRIESMWRERTVLFATIQERKKNYWSAVY